MSDLAVVPLMSPVDAGARARTLETEESFLVQAPAGSGKTELLTRRLLKLLAEVDEPEEILAITFTIAATAEMRERVLKNLHNAASAKPEGDPDVVSLAQAVLVQDRRRGWNLLQQPQRLSILTIDAVCLAIAHQTPVLSRLGGSLSPTDKPQPMYTLAARRTLARLGSEPLLSSALSALLELRAANLAGCEQLIAGMLDKRDQWARVLPLGDNTFAWEDVRRRLQAPLLRLHEDAMERAQLLFAHSPALETELVYLLDHACGNLDANADLQKLRGMTRMRHLSDHEHWDCLCTFLLVKDGKWRKRPPDGFQAKTGAAAKARYGQLLKDLEEVPGLRQALLRLRDLPPATYTDEESQMLQHLLLILRYAIAELRVVFAERGEVDFVELSLAAHQVLSGEDGKATLAAAEVAARWRHLLVDEFQDTSRSQYELLTLLAEGWESDRRGSCFLVGDPMQSIYLFRQAEVELFERTRKLGLGEGEDRVQFTPLQLQTNFRTHAGLVNPLNAMFAHVFSRDGESEDYGVTFAPSSAHDQEPRDHAGMQVWPFFLPSKAGAEEKLAVVEDEAKRVVRIVQQHWPRVAQELHDGGEYRIAVLVRARSHLGRIAHRLRAAGIPFRAVEIEPLGERPEVQDLTALTRALLHPMDRIAWLSVLRAPWCGLTLRDLHTLCGSDDKALVTQPVLHLLRERTRLLSDDGHQRATRVHAILEDALRSKHRQSSMARWIERTWATLGGHACVDRTGYENVRTFFDMLESLGPEVKGLAKRLEDLCAQPDPRANEKCGVQLMTIHKAKGLGFAVVIVPGLDRATAVDTQPLLRWIEQTRLVGPSESEQREFVVAPIGRNGQAGGIYQWIGKQEVRRQDDEAKRLLYVAATRAREELHLLGTAKIKVSDELGKGDKRSLLNIAWETLRGTFEAEFARQRLARVGAPAQLAMVFPEAARTIPLRRLPVGWRAAVEADAAGMGEEITEIVERPRGSLEARAFGTVVHALLEDLAGVVEALTVVGGWRERALVMLRGKGLPRAEADALSAEVVRALTAVLRDSVGRWILGARSEAQTEVSWSAWDAGDVVRTLRGDRVFRAGAEPGSVETTHLWIVDYKTARHGAAGLDGFLADEKVKYARQLEGYAEVLRKIYGEGTPIRMALYYPLLTRLVWW